MDNFQIETAQNVSINQNIAHVTTRIGSFFIDLSIIIAYYILITFFYGFIGYKVSFNNATLHILLLLPPAFYSLIFETFMNGQTPGKYVNKIRVVKLDGSKPTLGSFIIRWFLRLIDINLFSGSVAVVTILLNGKGQRLGDLAAGTTVISERKRIYLKDAFLENIQNDYQPTFPQVTVLTDKDIRTIRSLYQDARRKRNHKVILKLSIKISDLTGIKTEMKPIEFVDLIIKDYYYYTQK